MARRRRERARTPRVQITYDLSTENGLKKTELPFVIGVLGDFSGNAGKPLEKLRDRRFVDIDLGTFDAVMARMKPGLTLAVGNRLTPDASKLAVELQFRRLEDFEPEQVARQVPPLRELIEVRRRLSALRETIRRDPRVRQRLQGIAVGPERRSEATRADADGPGRVSDWDDRR
jgi:type VI secretion system protein ImpB